MRGFFSPTNVRYVHRLLQSGKQFLLIKAICLQACTVLLAALTGLQLEHWQFLQSGVDLFNSTTYVALLLIVPPAFYFFSKEILIPDSR